MAYTTLATQAAGQTASAAGWANLVKGNFESMMHLIARKTSDESVVSSAVGQNDDTLVLPVLANEIWQVEFKVIFSGVNTGDIRIGFNWPSGGSIAFTGTGDNESAVTTFYIWQSSTSPHTGWGFNCLGTGLKTFVNIEGVYINGATPGSLNMQWAQVFVNATATVVHAQSTLWGMKLA